MILPAAAFFTFRFIKGGFILLSNDNNIRVKFRKMSDDELISALKNNNEYSCVIKDILFKRYKGLIFKLSYAYSAKIYVDFEDAYGNFSYLFLKALEKYDEVKSSGSFRGFLVLFFRNKPNDDIGKRKARMTGVPKDKPFYFRNWDKTIISDEIFDED